MEFDWREVGDLNEPPNYGIIDTDYDNYAIVYHCSRRFFDTMHRESFWILTRTPTIDNEMLDKVYAIVGEKLPGYWNWTWRQRPIQGESFCYYPEYTEGN